MKQRIARLEERAEELESRVFWAESFINLMIPDIHSFRERLDAWGDKEIEQPFRELIDVLDEIHKNIDYGIYLRTHDAINALLQAIMKIGGVENERGSI